MVVSGRYKRGLPPLACPSFSILIRAENEEFISSYQLQAQRLDIAALVDPIELSQLRAAVPSIVHVRYTTAESHTQVASRLGSHSACRATRGLTIDLIRRNYIFRLD